MTKKFDRIDELRALAAQGMSDKEISEQLGACRACIERTRQAHGIPSGVSQTYERLRKQAKVLFASGANGPAVARELHVSGVTASRWKQEFLGPRVTKAEKVVKPKPKPWRADL